MSTKKCILCKEYRKEDNIIFQTDKFFVVPSLGQIVEGYLLICTIEHYLGIAHLPEDYFTELEKVKRKVRRVVTKTYTSPLFFEHGPVNQAKKGGCCVDHAHLHVVPVQVDIKDDIEDNFSLEEVQDLSNLKEFAKKDTPYFYYENQEEEKYKIPLSSPVPSQYLRRLISAKIGKPEIWNWKQHPEIEKFKKTINKLKGNF